MAAKPLAEDLHPFWCKLLFRRHPSRLAANEVRFQLHARAYNLANCLRTLATPEEIGRWSLTSLRKRLIKTGARLGAP